MFLVVSICCVCNKNIYRMYRIKIGKTHALDKTINLKLKFSKKKKEICNFSHEKLILLIK